MERLSDGRLPSEVIETRVMNRFKQKSRKDFRGVPYAHYTFEELFDLPAWLTLDMWILQQLRGRDPELLLELSLDHVVPINLAETHEELVKLQSWKNIRLLDKELNSRKSDYLDEENKLLGESLLGRPLEGREREVDEYQQQRDIDSGDRFAKLMSKGKGQSQRMKINGASAMQKKKDYRNKKRRK
jgi:5-methylcytosine-specific restriction endonuclease McrA